MKIGFFDSGIGGLTVLYDALKVFPNSHFIYFADSENVPYGTKSKKKIKQLTNDNCQFLIDMGLDLLVIACNTATSVAIKDLRKQYALPIVGMEPALKPASLIQNDKRILVCATKYTLKAAKLKNLITDLNADDRVELRSLQKLVTFAEESNWRSKNLETYLQKKLADIHPEKYSSVVLGCTHFIYYKNHFKKYLDPKIQIIDGNQGTVKRMLALIGNDDKNGKSSLEYYISKKKKKSKKLKKYLDYLKNTELK